MRIPVIKRKSKDQFENIGATFLVRKDNYDVWLKGMKLTKQRNTYRVRLAYQHHLSGRPDLVECVLELGLYSRKQRREFLRNKQRGN